MYYALEPEVAGRWGSETTVDTTVHPPKVTHLHYEFDGWLGDELLEAFPCFIVTEQAASGIRAARLSGVEWDRVMVTTSDQFAELHPGRQLPHFEWLRVTGTAGTDDFGLSFDHRLVASARALELLRSYYLLNCEVAVWSPS